MTKCWCVMIKSVGGGSRQACQLRLHTSPCNEESVQDMSVLGTFHARIKLANRSVGGTWSSADSNWIHALVQQGAVSRSRGREIETIRLVVDWQHPRWSAAINGEAEQRVLPPQQHPLSRAGTPRQLGFCWPLEQTQSKCGMPATSVAAAVSQIGAT
jgi:hypothetical protein